MAKAVLILEAKGKSTHTQKPSTTGNKLRTSKTQNQEHYSCPLLMPSAPTNE